MVEHLIGPPFPVLQHSPTVSSPRAAQTQHGAQQRSRRRLVSTVCNEFLHLHKGSHILLFCAQASAEDFYSEVFPAQFLSAFKVYFALSYH